MITSFTLLDKQNSLLGKVNEVTAENKAQQDTNHSNASRGIQQRCDTSLIGKLVLEVPQSDKGLEDRFYPEHHEHKILLPGTDLPWTRALQTLMRGWEMQ